MPTIIVLPYIEFWSMLFRILEARVTAFRVGYFSGAPASFYNIAAWFFIDELGSLHCCLLTFATDPREIALTKLKLKVPVQ